VLVAGLAAAPSAGWAQTYHDTGPLAVDEGTLDMDGMLTAGTVTLGLRVSAGPSTGTINYTWEQITAAAFGSDSTGSSFSHSPTLATTCTDNVISSGDPGYVALSGSTTGSITFTDAAMRENFGSPTFTAPEVAETTSFYFRVRYMRNVGADPVNFCRTYRVDVRDVQPPVVDLGMDQTVNEGETVTIRATTRGDPDGAGSVPFSLLTLTDGNGPAPSFNWLIQPRYGCASVQPDEIPDPDNPGSMIPNPERGQCIGDPTELQPAHSTTFTAPEWQVDYYMEFRVMVRDTGGRTATDTLRITVTGTNEPPVANAGPDQTVSEETALVTLDGSGSSDPEDDPLSYRWTQDSGPEVFLPRSIPAPSFRPPQLFADATLVFSLVVTDQYGSTSAADTVTINITADNDAPVVSIDKQFVGYNQQVTLLPEASDPEGSALSYSWERTDSAATMFTLSSTTVQRPIFTTPMLEAGAPAPVELEFRLTVTDSEGMSTEATAEVELRAGTAGLVAEPTPTARNVLGRFATVGTGAIDIRFNGVFPTVNNYPVANAGPDQTVSEGSTVTLAGSGSDADGDTLVYTWKLIGAGESLGRRVVLSDANAAGPTFTAPNLAVNTDLFFALVVEDERMNIRLGTASPPDIVRITVTASNEAPSVDLGPDQTLEEGDEVRFPLAVSDPEDGIVELSWTQDSGPAVQLPLSPNTVFPAPNRPEDYTLEFTLTGTDLHGATATDSVTISVSADSDAPIAVAGNYQADAGSTVNLNGGPRDFPAPRSFDPEGGALSYAWEQVLASDALDAQGQPVYDDDGRRTVVYTVIAADHADRVALTGANTATPSFTAPNRAASLLFRLTVTDAQSLTGVDVATVQVAGGAPAGADLTADAGDDLSAFEGAVVVLRGEANYPDSDLTFSWEQISGAPEVSLNSSAPNSARVPTFVAPDLSAASAILGFRLTVRHGENQIATDEMQVTVNRIFTVNAGAVVYVDSGLTNCMDDMGDPVDCPQVPSVSPDGITLAEGAEGFLNVEVVLDAGAPNVPRRYRYEWEQTSGQAVLLPQGQGGFSFLAPTPIAADMTLEFRVTVTVTHVFVGGRHPTSGDSSIAPMAVAPAGVISAVSAPVSVRVTRDASATRPTIGMNIAGEDITEPAGTRITLQGTVGSDPPDTRIIRRWTQISGAPVALQQVNESAGVASFISQRPGVLEFQFEVIVVSGTASTVPGSDPDALNMLSAIGSADSMQVTLTNRAPMANAGKDFSAEANAAVMLDGTDSRDLDEGDSLSYAWTQTLPPANPPSGADCPCVNFVVPVSLANANTATPTFTAPSLPAEDSLLFTLRVTDSQGEVSEDLVRVFVAADPAWEDADNPNRAPVAHAGADMQVLPGAQFTLDGRLSGDPDYAGLTRFDERRPALGYQWTQISGPAATAVPGMPHPDTGGVSLIAPGAPVNVARGASTTLTAPANAGAAPMEMVFRLVVTDGQLFSAPDDVTVTLAGNADASLANLAVNPSSTAAGAFATPGEIPLSPAFDSGTAAYSVPLPNVFTAIIVTAVPRARGETAVGGSLTGATVAVAGTDASGTALMTAAQDMSPEQFRVSGLSVGANTVTVTVTAPDGTATDSWTLTVTRGPAGGTTASTLDGLYLRTPISAVTSGSGMDAFTRNHGDLIALSPAFATATTSYTAQVPNRVESMRVTWLRSTQASSADSSTAMIGPMGGTAASCTINSMVGFLGDTGRNSGLLADCDLEEGANTLTLQIAEPDGTTDAATTYTVTVTRAAPSTDATLSALAVSGLRSDVSPAFAPATTEYTAQVGGPAMDVLPVTSHAGARFVVSGTAPGGAALAVNGAQVSGAATRLTGLLEGENTITIRVYAEDSTCFAREADGTMAASACVADGDTATTIRVPDTASPTTTQDYTLRITRIGTPPQIASVSPTEQRLFRGVQIAPLLFTNSGGTLPPGSWSVTPALPAGLSLDAQTGAISGTPTAAAAAADYTVNARNAWGDSSVVLNISVSASMRTVSVARVAETVAEDGTPGAAEFSLTMEGVSPTVDIEVAWTLSGADGAALPGAANADFGAPEGAGIAVAADGISGMARWASGATLPQTLTLRLPVLQDALNEGVETITLTLGALTAGGQTAPVREVELGGDASAVISVSASDAISVSLARAAGESGRLVSGDDANYVATLGSTASTQLMLSITATLGGNALTVPDVTLAALAATAPVVLPASLIDAATAAASGEVQLAVSVSGVSGAPATATAAPASDGSESAADIGVVGWELSLAPASGVNNRIQVGEGGALSLTASLRGTPAPAALMVPWSVTGGAAGADPACGANASAADFMGGAFPSATLDLSGETSGMISAQTAMDDTDESMNPECFTLTVGALTGANAGAVLLVDENRAEVSALAAYAEIADALRTIEVSAASATVEEGGTVEFVITMRGTMNPVSDVVVPWILRSPDDSLTVSGANSDLGAGAEASGTVTFAAGTDVENAASGVPRTVSVAIADDSLNEGPEQLQIFIDPAGVPEDAGGLGQGGVAGTLVSTTTADATVSASDPIAVSLARRSGDSGRLVSGDAARFTATLGATSSPGLMLGITAMLGSGSVTVPTQAVAAGSATWDFEIPACDATATPPVSTGCIDAATAAASGEVSLAVSVSSVSGQPSGATAAPASGGANAAADIPVVGWELSLAPTGSATERVQVGEGGALRVTVSLRGTPAPGALMVPWSVTGGVAATGQTCAASATAADFEGGFPGGTLDLSGEASGMISVPTLRDEEEESGAAECFTLNIGALTGANAGAVALLNDAVYAEIADALRTLSVSGPVGAVDEDSATGAGETAVAEFTITMRGSESPVEDVVVTWTLSSPDTDGVVLPAAAGLGRNVEARDVGGARTGTVTFAAGVTFPATQTVRVPILQDALNEGVENLQLMIDADRSAGGRMPGTSPDVPGTLVSTPTAAAQVAASDDIDLQVVAVMDDDGVLTPGESARFRLSFGTTTVNGAQVPIVPSTAITVPLTVDVGGQMETIQVMVAAEESSAEAEVPAARLAELRTMAGGGTPQITVNVGSISGTPSGAMSAVNMASLDAVRMMQLNVAQFGLRVAPQAVGDSGFAEAPEGGSYTVTFTLAGDAAALSAGGLTVAWQVAARAAMDGGREASANDFGGSTAYNCGGSTSADVACSAFPSGTVTFNTGDASQTLEIFIRDDGDDTEGTTPEGFEVRLMALGGADEPNTVARLSTGELLDQQRTLQVDIPALRADLTVADVSAGEGENAVFVLTLLNFVGGSQTTRNVVVDYTVGAASDTAEIGVDYLSAASGQATIPAGETTGEISIPLVRDGLLELPETFTLTLTQIVERGGGTIRFVDPNAAGQLPAVATITDTADQEQRREARVGTLVSVLERSSALHAADAISARINRGGMGAADSQTASLSLAGRELLGESRAVAGSGTGVGLALYGAAGQGGASAGLPGGGSGGAGLGSAGAAFGGLGAGLAGGANMGARSELPSLAKLVGGSAFNFNLAGWNWQDYSNMTLWGSGGVTLLDGSPVIGGAKLDYQGDSTSFFVGGENYVREDVLAGVALGFSFGDLEFTDYAATGYKLTGAVESDTISIHPYASWWLAPDVNVWLSLGYGSGTVNLQETIEESRGLSSSSAETDLRSISVTAGATGQLQVIDKATSLALNFQITRVMSELDATSFDNGAQLAAQNLRSTRVGGEAELGRDFALPIGATLRPFATAQVRLDLGDAVTQGLLSDRDAAMDLGGGADFTWPEQGVTLRLSGLAQLNDTGHQEHRFRVDASYDLGADGEGLTMELQSAFAARGSRRAAGADSAGAAAGALGSAGFSSAGGLGSGAGFGGGVRQSLSGEIGYGVAFRQFGRSGLLTPYGRFDLGNNARWTAGLRLSEPRSALELGLEAGVESSAVSTGRSVDLLLTGRLRF